MSSPIVPPVSPHPVVPASASPRRRARALLAAVLLAGVGAGCDSGTPPVSETEPRAGRVFGRITGAGGGGVAATVRLVGFAGGRCGEEGTTRVAGARATADTLGAYRALLETGDPAPAVTCLEVEVEPATSALRDTAFEDAVRLLLRRTAPFDSIEVSVRLQPAP